MSRSQRSTALYPHPFSRAYWRDAARELGSVRVLVFAALMIALRVAMKLVYIPLAPGLKINTAFLANALGAMVFGPVVAGLCAIVSDVLGYLINPEGIYFVPFVLTEIAGSMIFALFLYRAKVTPLRVMLSRFCICFFVNVVLQTPLMIWYYAVCFGGKHYALTVPGIIKNLFMFPIESVVLTLFLSVMLPITNRLGLTYYGATAKQDLKFTKKQVATLVVLFAVGVGSVLGFLGYYYDTTSLSAKYTDEERLTKNISAYTYLLDASEEYKANSDVLTIVESAYKKFLGKETTYTVAVYGWGEDVTYMDMTTQIWWYSKSKAAQDTRLERLSTVTLVVNDETGEVISCRIEAVK